MNKKELIVAAAAASGLSQKDVEKALKAVTETVVAEVAKKRQSTVNWFWYV